MNSIINLRSKTYPVMVCNYWLTKSGHYIFMNQLPISPLKMLFENEQTIIAYQDHENKIKIKSKPFMEEKLRLIFFSSGRETDYWNLLQTISVFNVISEEIEIYCPVSVIKKIKQYTNSHIRFIDINNIEEEIVTNIVITYSPGAIYFIKQKVPVIILGPNGLGGFVTPDNFSYLSREGFMGRPGGTLWEPVLPMMLMEEILSIRTSSDLENILEQNKLLAEKLEYIPLSKVPAKIKELDKHYDKLNHTAQKWRLVPRIASNISLVRNNDRLFFIRKNMNDTIATIEDEIFFNHIDGKNTFRQLLKFSEMEENDFWKLIHTLLKKKIILF